MVYINFHEKLKKQFCKKYLGCFFLKNIQMQSISLHTYFLISELYHKETKNREKWGQTETDILENYAENNLLSVYVEYKKLRVK